MVAMIELKDLNGATVVVTKELIQKIIAGERPPSMLGDVTMRAILADWLTEVEANENV